MALQYSLSEFPFTLSLIAAVTSVSWVVIKIYTALTSPLRTIPGPLHTRFTNLPLKLAIITGRRIHHIHSLHRAYGPVVRISPSEVSIADSDAFRVIYRAGSGFNKDNWYRRFTNRPSPGVFDMLDPKAHAARRRLFARAFTKTEIRTRWEGMVREKVELAIQKIGEEMERDGKVDLVKWLFFLATDISGHLMFGESFRTLEEGKKSRYIDTLQCVAQAGGIGVELPPVRFIGRFLPFTMFQGNDYLLEYGQRAVENSQDPESDKASIFTQLDPVDKKDPASQSLTELDIKVEAGNMIIAGTDTTAYSETYIIWTILQHPDIQSALEAEVANLKDDFRETDLETLPFLNAVIKEGMRLYGAVPGSMPRVVPKGGMTAADYFIPGGTTVSSQTWSIHRQEQHWPDAESFKPERWLADTAPDAGKAIWAPFGAGSRVCIGLHLAMMEMRYTSALFFRRFRGVRLAPETAAQKLEFDNFFLIKPKAGACFVTLS